MSGNLNISASESTIENVLQKSDRYTVPEYQRLYSWDEKQWEDFWRDLNAIQEDETHFLGSIVVIKHSGSYDELDKLDLVDGQQRLTTISLLLCALRDYYREETSRDDLADKIDDNYLYAHDVVNTPYQNLTLSKTDNDQYRSILKGEHPEAEGSRLLEAYEFFAERIHGLDDADIERVMKRLLGAMTLVVIDTENPESAFRLFETLNNRGMELSAVDLMKNSLLQEAMERYPDGYEDDDYKHIRDQWEIILKEVVREISKPNRFFRHYIMSASDPDVSSSISNYKLYDTFRTIIRNDLPTESTSLKDYINGMVDVSDLYLGFDQASVDVFESRPQKKINQRLANLNDIQSVHSRTLLLRTFQEFDEYQDINRVLKLLEVFMTRWKLAGYPSGSKLDSIFAGICSEAFDKSDPIDEIRKDLEDEAPDDDEFKVGIKSREFKRNNQTNYILSKLESIYFGGPDVNRSNVDIEHIAPQKAFSAEKYDSWMKVLSVSEEEYDNEYKNMLGNLTLLETRHNAAAGANPFDEKKQYYLSSNFEMTQEVRDFDDWDIDTIEKRTENLAGACAEVWDFDTYESL